MGQQQLLLIILGVIIVGIAIAVGLSLFSAQSVASNKDAIINDLGNLAATAYQFKIRPNSMGGGGGSYTGFTIPSKMSSNDNATYETTGTPGATVVYKATSANGTVTATVDAEGKLGTWVYTGSFL
jgi:hypothetical protein